MPQGGNISFSLVIIFLCGYLLNYKYATIVALVSVSLHFVLSLAAYYGVISLLFDYYIPFIIVGLSTIIPLTKIGNITLPLGMILAFGLKIACHLISGAVAFETPMGANLAYNLPYNLATFVTCFVLFIVLYPRLKKSFRA